MNLLESLADAVSKIGEFFTKFLEMVGLAIVALKEFYDMLVEFDDRIVRMVDNCGSSEFDGLPVIKAIATYHYVVGDIVFYLMYMVILFGCLFTIYKLLLLMYRLVSNFFSSITGVSGSGKLSGLLSKIFK